MTESTSPGETDPPGVLLYRGAEADILLGDWQGSKAVYKIRKQLKYRLKELDEGIRRHRTMREADMLHLAKDAGVPAPYLYDVDLPNSTIVMEYIDGKRLKEVAGALSKAELLDTFSSFGRDAARLHSAGLMHGDLTTANVMVRDGELVFIDFGLSVRSTKVEDHAVDLRLIKETLVGAHPTLASIALDALFEGYRTEAGGVRFRAVQKQLQGIERRGRYARVV